MTKTLAAEMYSHPKLALMPESRLLNVEAACSPANRVQATNTINKPPVTKVTWG